MDPTLTRGYPRDFYPMKAGELNDRLVKDGIVWDIGPWLWGYCNKRCAGARDAFPKKRAPLKTSLFTSSAPSLD